MTPAFRSIVVTADEVAPGMTLNYPTWRDRRPAGAAGNVNPEPQRVKALVEHEHNRVIYFEGAGPAVVGRTARLELVVPEHLLEAVDALTELEAAIAEKGLEGEELKRTAHNLARVRGAIIRKAVGDDPYLGQ